MEYLPYKSSLQTLEGKLVLAINIAYGVGIVAAAAVDVALKQPVFSHYSDQLTAAFGIIAALNGWFAKVRTDYKISISSPDSSVG